MKIDTSTRWLPVYEALASEVRLKIIELLAQRSMNIKEIAGELNLSSAIITMHIKKLEQASIIKCVRNSTRNAVQKLCSLSMDSLEIEFPGKPVNGLKHHGFSVPVGHYTDFSITPTCGLATAEKIIGHFDDPRSFWEPERVNAEIVWFTQGYVEYKLPNYLLSDQEPKELEISLELSSEAPGINNNWPSDITFFLNGERLGMWTSPGDFGGSRGKFTPIWWSMDVAQYGLYKRIRINDEGTFIDGMRVSDVTLSHLNLRQKSMTFRIAVLEESEHVGGVTLFGKEFGNYNQDIVFKLYYKQSLQAIP